MRDKIAIVTGGSQGIGAAITENLAAKGIIVVVNYSNNTSEAEKIINRILKNGGQAVAIKANIGNTDEVKYLFAETDKKFGRLDIVVNCAGLTYFKPTTIAEITDEFFDEMYNLNVKGTLRCLRESVKYIRTEGRIITFSSTGTVSSHAGFGAYTSSKCAIEILTKVLSNELRGKNITVNCVSPGAVATTNWLKGKTEQVLKTVAELSPLERLGTPKDIAEVVSFLVSKEGEWINGQVIRTNGGFV